MSDSHSQANLSGHGSTTDNRLIQFQALDNRGEATNIAILRIRVSAWEVASRREASPMTWKIERVHPTQLPHPLIIHNSVVLSTI